MPVVTVSMSRVSHDITYISFISVTAFDELLRLSPPRDDHDTYIRARRMQEMLLSASGDDASLSAT